MKKASDSSSKTFFRLMKYVGKARYLMLGVLLFALVGNTLLMIAPRLVGEAIDLILPGHAGSLLVMLGWIALCYIGGSLLTWLTSICANLVANRTVRELRNDLFQKLGKLPMP